jgi:hypothetical protein
MRKILFALFLAIFIFIILNFLYCNLNAEVFNYPMSFRFEIPYILSLKSVPVPLGFVVIAAFSLGILFLALLQAIPALFKTIALRSRDRRIKELEKELEETRRAAPSDVPAPSEHGSDVTP